MALVLQQAEITPKAEAGEGGDSGVFKKKKNAQESKSLVAVPFSPL